MSTLEVTNNQLKGFTEVWKQLLKQKVKIVFEISKEKNEDFLELLKEFVPEAFENEDLWKDEYILKPTEKINIEKTVNQTIINENNNKEAQPKKKKIMKIKKKSKKKD